MNHKSRKLLQGVRSFASACVNRIANHQASMSLADNPLHNDVYLVSYPKSGNTWLDFLIANVNLLMSRASASVTFYNVHQYVPDIHLSRNLAPPLLDFPGYRIIKSHSSYNLHYKNVIYLSRDPRDVMVSYYHFLRGLGQFGGSVSELLRSERFGIRSWASHVEGWFNESPAALPFIVVRYEDLKSDAESAVSLMYAHLGFSIPSDVVKKAVELASLQNMKTLESAYGYGGRRISAELQFVRNGVSGEGRIQLDAEDLNFVLTQAGDAMKLLRYL